MLAKYALFYLFFMVFSVYASIGDVKTGAVSRPLLWTAIAASCLGKLLFFDFFSLIIAAMGCILGLAVFFLVYRVSGKRLGLADVWYAGLMGSVLGPLWWYPAVFVACLLALAAFIKNRRRSIPFIPFLSAGAAIILPFAWRFDVGSWMVW